MRLVLRSALVLLLLFGLLYAVGTAALVHYGAPVWFGVVFALLITALQYAFSPALIRWIMRIVWIDVDGLPAPNAEFVRRHCGQRGLKLPRFGIIEEGTPNAFSFGHVPSDACVVVTRGLLDTLTPEESNAVLAHEIGHIAHWDFVIITLASAVPLILYQIYVLMRPHDRGKNSGGAMVGLGALLCYYLSQYLVLMLNRVREFYADSYSAEATGQPNDLSTALVKIAYGMVKADGSYRLQLQDAPKDERKALRAQHARLGSLGILGISCPRSGAALALCPNDPKEAAAVMSWDRFNPWARYYELASTHPVTADRVEALNEEAQARGQKPAFPMPEGERHWGRFLLELALDWAPAALVILCCVPLIGSSPELGQVAIVHRVVGVWPFSLSEVGPVVLLLGAALSLRVWYRYHGEFQPAEVLPLLARSEASEMNSIPVSLHGKIIGRGNPGLPWSADVVLQDKTGYVFAIYANPLPFARLIFGLGAIQQFLDAEVTLTGWYRRGMRPYVEIGFLRTHDRVARTQVVFWKGLFCAFVLAAGIFLAFAGRAAASPQPF
jgi:Zn-dependent protease with chaperone function